MVKKNKSKISKVKRTNQTATKMAKQGKNKMRRHKKKTPQKQRPQQPEAPSSEESENDMMDMIDPDDLEYLRKTPSSLLGSVRKDDTSVAKPPRRKRRHSGSDSGLEEEYEEQASADPPKKTRPLLPIKTKDGIVTRETEVDESSDEEKPQQPLLASENEEEGVSGSDSDTGLEADKKDLFEEQETLSAADLMLARKQELREKKYKIGTLASGLLESPEKKLRNFYPLLGLMDEKSKDDTPTLLSVRKLATVSVCEVFKDILPEYQFKHQDYSNVKLKKDTLSLYKYEKELLEMYKRYLQRLEKAANVLRKKRGDHRAVDPATYRLGVISLQCLCGMLSARPYFNFATNISQTVIPFLNNRDPEVRDIVSQCCSGIFTEDKKGEISVTLVRRINHLVKSRAHNIQPAALRCLLALRIKDVDLDAEKQLEVKQKTEEQKKKRIINLSKKEKKRNKKLREVEQELLETQAEESRLTKQQHLTEVTRTVFMIYFRVLKTAPQSTLLSATLEGLSKFAHVINLEYYSDLVAILSRLLSADLLGHRQRLHCVQTVFAILSGQGDVLNIDPSEFYKHLYCNMLSVHAGKTQEDALIVIKTMDSIVVKRRRKISHHILLAYVKRLATLSLQLQHHAALACLVLVGNVLQHCKLADSLLSLDESVGSGRYDPMLPSPEHCSAQATALFEVAALLRHYHPSVRRLAAAAATGATLPEELARLSAEQIYKQYDGTQMAFKPSIPVPRTVQPKKRLPAVHTFAVTAFQEYCEQITNSVDMSEISRLTDFK